MSDTNIFAATRQLASSVLPIKEDAAMLEITVNDHDNSWTLPCTRQSWAMLVAAAAMSGVSEGAAIDRAFTAYAAPSLDALHVPAAAKVRPPLTWWQFVLMAVVVIAAFAFNSLVIGHR